MEAPVERIADTEVHSAPEAHDITASEPARLLQKVSSSAEEVGLLPSWMLAAIVTIIAIGITAKLRHRSVITTTSSALPPQVTISDSEEESQDDSEEDSAELLQDTDGVAAPPALPALPARTPPPQPLPPLLLLPDELLVAAASVLLASDLPSVLRLRQACKTLRSKLEPVRAEAEARQLRWMPDATVGHSISNKYRTLTSVSTGEYPWAAATLLPTVGQSFWRVRVDVRANEEDGGMLLGVCDQAGNHAWGLDLAEGKLFRASRGGDGVPIRSVTPAGWPNGHGVQVMRNERGRAASLRGKASGAVVEVRVDHDAGTLAYRINESLPFEALPKGRGFPIGAALRPWASLFMSAGDRVTLVPVWRPWY